MALARAKKAVNQLKICKSEVEDNMLKVKDLWNQNQLRTSNMLWDGNKHNVQVWRINGVQTHSYRPTSKNDSNPGTGIDAGLNMTHRKRGPQFVSQKTSERVHCRRALRTLSTCVEETSGFVIAGMP